MDPALMQAIGGGGVPEEEMVAPQGGDISAIISLLQSLIEQGKIDPATAEAILQALGGMDSGGEMV